MDTLQKKYGIKSVNLVGHSMGGLAATNLLLNRNAEASPIVQKLVVIASPFTGIFLDSYFKKNYGEAAYDLQSGSKALQSMKNKNFPLGVEVLAIAGVINRGEPRGEYWDGLVHLRSVRGISEMVPPEQLSGEIIFDHQATHSGLHEIKAVDEALQQFLWE